MSLTELTEYTEFLFVDSSFAPMPPSGRRTERKY